MKTFILEKVQRHSKTEYLQFIWEIAKFAMVGCSNVAINLAGYWVLMLFGVHYVPAYGISYMMSVLNAYFMSNKFVFKETEGEERNRILSMIRVFAVYIGIFVISELLLTLQIDYLHWKPSLAPILNLIVTSPVSFLLNKFWAFGSKKTAVIPGV